MTRVAGNRVAEDVISEHLDTLYRAAVRLCGGRAADADDLVQNVALKAFERFHELREIRAARAWLLTILTRTHLNRLRASRRRPEVTVEDLDDAGLQDLLETWESPETPEATLDRRRTSQSIVAAFDALDADLRVVAWLVDVEGFRHREVSDMLGVPEGTVASRLFRARRMLRLALARHMGLARQAGRE